MGLFEELVNIYISTEIGFNFVLMRILVAIILLLLGISLGKIIPHFLSKFFKKINLERNVRPSFITLTLWVLEWIIYIIFVNLALMQIPMPIVSSTLSKLLLIIPALAASLLIISAGFALAIYLRGIVEDSEVTEWKFLSMYIFYFIILISGIYSLKLSLIFLNNTISSAIIISIAIIFMISVGYTTVKNNLVRQDHTRK